MNSRSKHTRELLARIGDPTKPRHTVRNLPEQVSAASSRILAVADSTSVLPLPVLKEAAALRRLGLSVQLKADRATAASLRRYVGAIEPVDETDISLPASAKILIVAASPAWMAKVALGIADSLTGTLTLKALMRKITVFADLDGCLAAFFGEQMNNQALTGIYDNYRCVLLSLGVRQLGRGDMPLEVPRYFNKDYRQAKAQIGLPDRHSEKRTFITKRDIERHHSDIMQIAGNTVVTDEAKETAARLKIRIVKA